MNAGGCYPQLPPTKTKNLPSIHGMIEHQIDLALGTPVRQSSTLTCCEHMEDSLSSVAGVGGRQPTGGKSQTV